MRCEKNKKRLVVHGRCLFERFVQELVENPQIEELSIEYEIEVPKTYFFHSTSSLEYPPLRKLWITMNGSKSPEITRWLTKTFAKSLYMIDCYDMLIPRGLCFPQLRYMRFVVGDFYYHIGPDPKSLYPNLTHVHVPDFRMIFPSIDLGPPVVIYGDERESKYTEFCSNILRNQKRELAAQTLYLCVKKVYKSRDLAKLLMNHVFDISNIHWKLTKNDVTQSKDKKIYFSRYTQEFVYLQTQTKSMLEYIDRERYLDQNIVKVENSLAKMKRERDKCKHIIGDTKSSIDAVTKNIKKRKTNFIDDAF